MKRACVIGWPITHSLSPVIHGYWLKSYGIDGDYVKEAVEPHALPDFLLSLEARGYSGCNVTIPHKIETYRLCTAPDAAAKAIGAVNTLWLDGGTLHGSNTDAAGFLANMDEAAPGWDARLSDPVVVIGAGGAARAIVWALAGRGFSQIRIVNRGKGRAEELSTEFPPARAFGFDALPEALTTAAVIVNATSLGMSGQPPLSVALDRVAPDATVCDIVYHPLETDLLRQARARGLRAVDGLGMLLHQAAPGFEKWFGVRPAVTQALRAKVLDAIAARERAPA